MQRHDLLNHLQVVSGLAQLKKGERVMEYIASIAKEVGVERSITKLLPLEGGLAVLCWLGRLKSLGISYDVDLSVDLGHANFGAILADIIYQLLGDITNNTSKPTEILFRSHLCGQLVELSLRAKGFEELPFISLGRPQELARQMGGKLTMDQSNDTIHFRIMMPVQQIGLPGIGA